MKRNLLLMLALCVGIFLLVLSLRPAPGAEITVQPKIPPGHWDAYVTVEGKLNWWDAVVFKRLTEKLSGNIMVGLHSPGGSCDGAISIGSFIRMNRWSTNVGITSSCSSACALIWFGGAKRYLELNARIGVHSVGQMDDHTKRNDKGNDVVAAYLRALDDVPEEVIRRWRKAEPTEMDYIYRTEALRLGLIDGSWSQHPKNPPAREPFLRQIFDRR